MFSTVDAVTKHTKIKITLLNKLKLNETSSEYLPHCCIKSMCGKCSIELPFLNHCTKANIAEISINTVKLNTAVYTPRS